MKVFISWSGHTSHSVAKVLRDWIPSVIQAVKPYVSSEDIDKGSRWSSDIAGELDSSSYGIICLTKENILAPWINFEAGALGKSVDKSNVSPFLFRINPSDISGPLVQYQSTKYDESDILKLTQSINACCGDNKLEPERLKQIFDVWWPKLKEKLDEIPQENPAEPQKRTKVETNSVEIAKFSNILEELLELSRGNYKLLRDPSALLPQDYLLYATNQRNPDDEINSAIADLAYCYRILIDTLHKEEFLFAPGPIKEAIENLEAPIKFLCDKKGVRVRRRRITNSDVRF